MLNSVKEKINSGEFDEKFLSIYLDESLISYQRQRYVNAIDEFEKNFGAKNIRIFSAPGRSEVCGNHTDHQWGMVLATSINLDAIGIVSPLEEKVIRLKSEGFDLVEVDLNDTDIIEEEKGTTASLIRGVAAGFEKDGYEIGGFEAYVTSDVLVGAGLSSSAAFESLIGTIFSHLYNKGTISSVDIAKLGQYAENIYFGKPCGLMDQMACSVGGLVFIDFEDDRNPVVKKAECDFSKAGYSLCIVDTKGSHADLTPDYAAVPQEMNQVAAALGKKHLREVDEKDFYASVPKLRNDGISDRAILRAIHFFEEDKRVLKAFNALNSDDFNTFLGTVKASGDSSAKFLQNIYSPRNLDEQNVTLGLAVSEGVFSEMSSTKENADSSDVASYSSNADSVPGICRVHGGGFAGTIQAFVRNEYVENYRTALDNVFGAGSCHVLKIRPVGGVRIL